MLTPDTGELVYSSAGHPPPILVAPDGTTQSLDNGHTIALGIRHDWPPRPPEARITLPARATLALYTDGLVERRSAPHWSTAFPVPSASFATDKRPC